MGKIEKIRERFKDKELYKPCQLEIPQVTKFAPFIEQQLGKLIANMPSNSCQLDAIPTDKLKQRLDKYIPIITYITNIPLETNESVQNKRRH